MLSFLRSTVFSVRSWGSENHHLDLLEFCVLGNIKQNPNTQSLSQTGKRTVFRGPELLRAGSEVTSGTVVFRVRIPRHFVYPRDGAQDHQ